MRIMIVAACFPPHGWGGAEVAAEGIARWLAEHGHHIGVYTDLAAETLPAAATAGDHAWYAPALGSQGHRAHEHGRKGPLRKAWWHVIDHGAHRGEAEFARATEAFRPDLVMVHLAPGLGLGLFAHCAAADLPVIFVMHDFWMTCLRSSMFSRSGTVCTQREWACQWSSRRRLAALLRVPRLGFWAPSQRIVDLTRKQAGPVLRNLLVERNVVDLDDFSRTDGATTDADRSAAAPVRFLFVGKITEAKGVLFLVEALLALPAGSRFELDLAGGGDLELSLQRRLADDPRFHFHGVRSRAEIVGFYHRASVLLVPSLWFENSPLVIYQAQAAGLPVVGSDSGGIPELLQGREDSMLLPAGDHAAWHDALQALVEEPARVARLEQAGRQAARDGAGVRAARGRRVEALCRQLIALPPADAPAAGTRRPSDLSAFDPATSVRA